MPKNRKHVEVESDLDNSETQKDNNHGVESPNNNLSDNLGNNETEQQDQDGQNTQSQNTPSQKGNDTSTGEDATTNEDGNTNNKVFDGQTEDSNLDKDSEGNNVESDGGQLSNENPEANTKDDNNNQENNDNNEDNNNQENAQDEDGEDKDVDDGSDSTNSNDEKDNKTPSQGEGDDNNNSKVTDSSEQQDEKDNGLKDIGSDKLGKLSDTANKMNKLRDFKDLKNMSKERATREALEIGKDLAKKKLMAAFMTYVAPFLLPILAGLVAILIIIFIILAAVSGSDGNNKASKKDCKPVNESSTDLKVSKDGTKNAEKIFKHEMKKVDGAKPKAVAAHLGNMAIETGHTFDPKIIQGDNDFKEDIAKDESVGGYAFGLAQWDSGRRVNLLKYAEKKNKKWSDFGVQLDFLLNHDGTDSDTIKKLLKSDGSVDSITEKIMSDWERAGDKSSLSERQSAASKFYSKFGKKDVDSSDGNLDDATDAASDNSDASENSGCSNTDDTGGSGKLGDSTKANDKSGKIIKKWDSKKDIPSKYKKHIKIPDFKEKILDSPENIFPATGNKGQCTELTWGYMKQMYGKQQPTNGNGNVIYKAYKAEGAKVTNNPTVGYGFSSDPPYAGAADASVGHTGIVAGVLDNGQWIMANYNLNGEGNNGQRRHLTYALVDGNKKSGGTKFFSGIGKPKVKSKD